MQIRFKKAMAGAVLLGLAAAPARADRIPYLDPVRVPEAGLHPYPIQRLHAGIAWLRAHALHARPEAKPVKEILAARGGPRMESFDVPEAVRHQLRSLGGAGMDILPEGDGRYSRSSVREALHSLDFVPGLAVLPPKAEQVLEHIRDAGLGFPAGGLSGPSSSHFGSAPGPAWSIAPEDPVMEAPAVPEPASLGLMALGLLGMGWAIRRRQA